MRATRLFVLSVALATAGTNADGQVTEPDTGDTPYLDEIIVSGERISGKTGVPLSATPQNIQVLSGKLLRDQGADLLQDALENIAGVQPGSFVRAFDLYRIRGFDVSSSTFVDGLRRGVAINAELAGLESIEVLKGPSAVLFGQGSPGGLVNLVTKRPSKHSQVEVELSTGSYSSYSGMIDVSGSITDDQDLYGRFISHYRDDKSFIDFKPATRRLYVAPSLTWDIGPGTRMSVLASASKDWSELAPDQPAEGLVYAGPLGYYDRDLYIGDPDDMGRIIQDFTTAGWELHHEFNDAVTIYQRARYSHLDLEYRNIYQPLAYDPTTGLQMEYVNDQYEDRDIFTVDTGLNMDAATGSLEHKLTIGVEYDDSEIDSDFVAGFAPAIFFDLYNPDYSVFAVDQPKTSFPGKTESESLGIYLQDTIQLVDGMHLTLGGRYDEVEINRVRFDEVTPRAGVTYDFTPGVTGFLSYAKSFVPQAGFRDPNGNPVDPETGESYEVGVKLALKDGRFNSTLAIFEITRANVATARPDSFYDVTGEQRSRGFEFDGQFRLTDALEVVSSYAYIDAEVVADNVLPVGDTPFGVPEHKGSLWVRYSFQSEPWHGLSASLGGTAYSSQEASLPNTYELPSYAVVNANIAYRAGSFSLQLLGTNILNEEYISGAIGPLFVVSGDPGKWRLTAGWSF